jgi:hypothetical protein
VGEPSISLSLWELPERYRTLQDLSKPDTEKIVEENILYYPSRQDKLIIQEYSRESLGWGR